MISVKIELDKPSLKNALTRVGRNVERSQRRATERALKRTHRLLVDTVYDAIRLKKTDIRKKYTEFQKGFSGLEGQITIFGKPVSLINFVPGRKKKRVKSRPGLSIKVYRNKPATLYRGSFSAAGKNDNIQVFKRKGDSRLPLQKLFGPGPREVFEFPGVSEKLTDFASSEYQKEFETNFQRLENIRRN